MVGVSILQPVRAGGVEAGLQLGVIGGVWD